MSDKKPQDNTTFIAMPVCPYCKTVMEVTRYEGYYDSLSYWACECDDDELAKKAKRRHRGSYA